MLRVLEQRERPNKVEAKPIVEFRRWVKVRWERGGKEGGTDERVAIKGGTFLRCNGGERARAWRA